MKTHRTMKAVAAVAVALLAAPASAGNETAAVEDAVTIGHDEGQAGYDTVPSAGGHGVKSTCSMVRTNKTLVKWGGQAAAAGHVGVTFTAVTCYLLVSGPGTAYTVARTATAAGPSASAWGATGVAPDTTVSVCVHAAEARWADGHRTLYANPRCMNLN